MTARKRRQYRAPDFARDLLHAAEVALRGRGEAGLDDIDPKSIELAGEAKLLLGRHGVAWACSRPQGRVENENVLQHCVLVSFEAKEKPRTFSGSAAEGLDVVSTMLLPVNARDPAEAPKEDQDEANKDEEQQGRHVRHQAHAGTLCNDDW
jgi:hypothetical protein